MTVVAVVLVVGIVDAIFVGPLVPEGVVTDGLTEDGVALEACKGVEVLAAGVGEVVLSVLPPMRSIPREVRSDCNCVEIQLFTIGVFSKLFKSRRLVPTRFFTSSTVKPYREQSRFIFIFKQSRKKYESNVELCLKH